MKKIKKHTDVIATVEEFETNLSNGVYASPYVVYVGNNTDGYKVFYSNDENRDLSIEGPDFIESIKNRISKLEQEKVYCYEDEYEKLVAEGGGFVTKLDGTREEILYDPNKTYCIYEEDGPVTVE